MTMSDFKSWMGTTLAVYGLGALAFAAVVGVVATGAEALGVDRGTVMFLAVTAICWAVVGLYFVCWGHKFQDNFHLP